jgi:hypothetical protein
VAHLSNEKLKVLFIVGWDRSGSTILDNLLGEVEGFFSGGELRHLWKRGILQGWTCGCGLAVTDCPLWSAILDSMVDQSNGKGPDPQTIARWQQQLARLRHTRRLLRQERNGIPKGSMLEAYIDVIASLYESVALVTGARVVVDSFKAPSEAAILDLIPNIRPYFVHLVRDPRAVAYSWSKHKQGVGRHGVFYSTVMWVAHNLASEEVRRRRRRGEQWLLVRYEDFAEAPVHALTQIVEMVGEDPRTIPLHANRSFRLTGNHSVSGNPSRFLSGLVEVRPDNKWLEDMGKLQKAVATLLALPLLSRYHYPFWSRQF